jgi:hypothetical protein
VIRRVCSWWTVGAAAATSAVCACIALRINPPSSSVASSCVSILAAALAVKVLAWVATSGASFGREERLVAFVMLLALGLGWLASEQWIGERDFDYHAAQQKAELIVALRDLSSRITRFAGDRDRMAPPRPRPATWQHDVDTFDKFEADTAAEYERRFGAKVRMAHDLVALRGLLDRDFEMFFRRPANEFQIRVVAKKLDSLATRLSRR